MSGINFSELANWDGSYTFTGSYTGSDILGLPSGSSSIPPSFGASDAQLIRVSSDRLAARTSRSLSGISTSAMDAPQSWEHAGDSSGTSGPGMHAGADAHGTLEVSSQVSSRTLPLFVGDTQVTSPARSGIKELRRSAVDVPPSSVTSLKTSADPITPAENHIRPLPMRTQTAMTKSGSKSLSSPVEDHDDLLDADGETDDGSDAFEYVVINTPGTQSPAATENKNKQSITPHLVSSPSFVHSRAQSYEDPVEHDTRKDYMTRSVSVSSLRSEPTNNAVTVAQPVQQASQASYSPRSKEDPVDEAVAESSAMGRFPASRSNRNIIFSSSPLSSTSPEPSPVSLRKNSTERRRLNRAFVQVPPLPAGRRRDQYGLAFKQDPAENDHASQLKQVLNNAAAANSQGPRPMMTPSTPEVIRRRRGRPRKTPSQPVTSTQSSSAPPTATISGEVKQKKRGRVAGKPSQKTGKAKSLSSESKKGKGKGKDRDVEMRIEDDIDESKDVQVSEPHQPADGLEHYIPSIAVNLEVYPMPPAAATMYTMLRAFLDWKETHPHSHLGCLPPLPSQPRVPSRTETVPEATLSHASSTSPVPAVPTARPTTLSTSDLPPPKSQTNRPLPRRRYFQKMASSSPVVSTPNSPFPLNGTLSRPLSPPPVRTIPAPTPSAPLKGAVEGSSASSSFFFNTGTSVPPPPVPVAASEGPAVLTTLRPAIASSRTSSQRSIDLNGLDMFVNYDAPSQQASIVTDEAHDMATSSFHQFQYAGSSDVTDMYVAEKALHGPYAPNNGSSTGLRDMYLAPTGPDGPFGSLGAGMYNWMFDEPPPELETSPSNPTIDPALLGLPPSVMRPSPAPEAGPSGSNSSQRLPSLALSSRTPSRSPTRSPVTPLDNSDSDDDNKPLSSIHKRGFPFASSDGSQKSKRVRRLTERAYAALRDDDDDILPSGGKMGGKAKKGKGKGKGKDKAVDRDAGKGKERAQVEAEDDQAVADATFCHQCRRTSTRDKMRCTAVRKTGMRCGLLYCERCIELRYPDMTFNPYAVQFKCPRCEGICNCTKCCADRGEVYISARVGKLPPPGSMESLALIAEATEGTPPAELVSPAKLALAPGAFFGVIYGLGGERVGDGFMGEDNQQVMLKGTGLHPSAPARKRGRKPKQQHIHIGNVVAYIGYKRTSAIFHPPQAPAPPSLPPANQEANGSPISLGTQPVEVDTDIDQHKKSPTLCRMFVGKRAALDNGAYVSMVELLARAFREEDEEQYSWDAPASDRVTEPGVVGHAPAPAGDGVEPSMVDLQCAIALALRAVQTVVD